MVELFVIAAVLGAVAGGFVAFTHQLFITKTLAKQHAEYDKAIAEARAEWAAIENLKAKL